MSGAACSTVSAVRDRTSSSSAQRGQDSTCDSVRARSRPVSTPSASSANSLPYSSHPRSSLMARALSARSTAARKRINAVLIRVFAVPSGIPSDSLISSAVLP